MIILRNPTEQEVTIAYRGASYSIAPFESKEVAEELAEFWTGIHGFLQTQAVVKTTAPEVQPEIVEPKEEKEEKKEEKADEPKADKPKKAKK